jgi:hypothetical protein
MKDEMLTWLGDASSWAWHASLLLIFLVNAVAVTAVVVTRDRALVDRWTSRWLAANLGLIGFGVAAPTVIGFVRLALAALPAFGTVAATAK